MVGICSHYKLSYTNTVVIYSYSTVIMAAKSFISLAPGVVISFDYSDLGLGSAHGLADAANPLRLEGVDGVGSAALTHAVDL
jgi:hypothetical protein